MLYHYTFVKTLVPNTNIREQIELYEGNNISNFSYIPKYIIFNQYKVMLARKCDLDNKFTNEIQLGTQVSIKQIVG